MLVLSAGEKPFLEHVMQASGDSSVSGTRAVDQDLSALGLAVSMTAWQCCWHESQLLFKTRLDQAQPDISPSTPTRHLHMTLKVVPSWFIRARNRPFRHAA